jgi:ABC-type branched-subunit amino acid transport system ATPase component
VHALEVTGLGFAYGRATVLDGIDLAVEPGEIVTVIGPNGAGKSTLLGVVSRALRPTAGRIALGGEDTSRLGQADVVRRGCLLVPEGRQVFASMSVADNLTLGRWSRRRSPGAAEDLARVHDLFPRLHERRSQLAGTLSGGEQQMLAIGRAMMGRPTVMLLDEPSLGLSPQMVARIMDALAQLRDGGLTIVLVEQNARAALALADRAHLLQAGRVVLSGTAAELAADPTVAQVYLGGTATPAP